MKKNIYLIIILMLALFIPLSYGLRTTDSKGNSVICQDYSEYKFREYILEFGTYTAGENPYYKVVESANSPITYDDLFGYTEYPMKPGGTGNSGIDNEAKIALLNKFREEVKNSLDPGDVPIYNPQMGWVSFSIDDAANNVASDKSVLEYFVRDEECIPCNKRDDHQVEYYDKCTTCEEHSPGTVLSKEKGYCVKCAKGFTGVNDECVLIETLEDEKKDTGAKDETANDEDETAIPEVITVPKIEDKPKECDESENFNPSTKNCESKCSEEQKWDFTTKRCIAKENINSEKKLGCTDIEASNYKELATTDDGSCKVCKDGYSLVESFLGDKCIQCHSGRKLIDGKCVECPKSQFNHENSEYREETVIEHGNFVKREFGTKHVDASCNLNPCYNLWEAYEKQDWFKSDKDKTAKDDAYNKKLKEAESTGTGKITFKKGRVLVEKGIDIIPGLVGTILYPGDTVVVEEGAEAAISLNDQGLIKVTQKTKFMVPLLEQEGRLSKSSYLFYYYWCRAKNGLQGEHFEIETPTAANGVRG